MADNSRNPFYSGSDKPAGSFNSYNPGFGQQQPSSLQEQVQVSQDRQLETQRRALRSLHQSEQMGVSTAEELVRQGEVLNRTEERLDHIATVQKDSQRHITSLSSVFGGFKNLFRGGSAKDKPKQPGDANSRYGQPGQSLQSAMASSSAAQVNQPQLQERQLQQQQQQQQMDAGSSAYDRRFNENLNDMSSGVGRLKELAKGLGTELDRQNVQLDRLQDKTEQTNATMDDQNRAMNRILYGSKAPK